MTLMGNESFDPRIWIKNFVEKVAACISKWFDFRSWRLCEVIYLIEVKKTLTKKPNQV